jgi:hypothetical protein
VILEYKLEDMSEIVQCGNYSGEYIKLKDLYPFLIKKGDIGYDLPYTHNVGFSIYKMAFSKKVEIIPNAYNILGLVFYGPDLTKQLIKEADDELDGVDRIFVVIEDKGKKAIIGACDGVALYEKTQQMLNSSNKGVTKHNE